MVTVTLDMPSLFWMAEYASELVFRCNTQATDWNTSLERTFGTTDGLALAEVGEADK